MARVLVIDDEPDVRWLIRLSLERAGHEVIDAEDGLRGVALAQKQRPEIIVLDLMMPVMDGFSFIEACHREQLCVDVPIVVITAVQDALRRINEVPVHACVAKPFDLAELVRTVEHFARGSNGRA